MPLSVGKTAHASVYIAAPVETVWAIVGDVTRAGEWSVECRGCEWLDGATAPAPGARFRGRNRRNITMWSRICEVDAVEPGQRLVWHTVATRLLPDSTEWSFELAPEGEGTKLTESMRVRHISKLLDRLFAVMLPQHRDRTPDLEADLQRIKAVAERQSVSRAS